MKVNAFGFLKDSSVDDLLKEKGVCFQIRDMEVQTLQRWSPGQLKLYSPPTFILVFPGGSNGKEYACNAGDPSWISGLGRSPGKENSNPLQYSWLENPMDRGAWQATFHRVAKSWTQLSDLKKKKCMCCTWYLCILFQLYCEPKTSLKKIKSIN